MTEQTYTGDLSIALNGQGDWDITYENGQPLMTDGFDTCITLALFGEPDFWQNELTNDPDEKYISELPAVIKTGKVNNDTINNGTAAIKNALAFMISSNMAKTINVTGGILSVHSIQWTIDITKPDDTNVKYDVNWEKGVISVAGLSIFEGRNQLSFITSPMLNPSGEEMLNPSGELQLYVFEG